MNMADYASIRIRLNNGHWPENISNCPVSKIFGATSSPDGWMAVWLNNIYRL